MWAQFAERYGKGQPDFIRSTLSPNQVVYDCFQAISGGFKDPDTPVCTRVPQNLNFKLAILGRALSGKKSIAS